MSYGHDCNFDGGKPAAAEGEMRRRSLRAQGLRRFTVFLVSTLLVFGHVEIVGAFRVILTSLMGETTQLCILGAGAFALLLVPMILCEPFLARDRLLYCPHCREYLIGIRSLHRLNTKGECRGCGKQVPIAKASPLQIAFDMAFAFGGLGLLIMAAWLMSSGA